MQIRIDVVAMKGTAAAQPVGASFDVSGGTIGRVASNTLILDDPDRTVSRVHAQIVFRNNAFVILDRGSNPIQLNGQFLGAGNEALLRPGDQLFIGSFELRVKVVGDRGASSQTPVGGSAALLESLEGSFSSSDPFADLLDGLPNGATSVATKPKSAPLPQAMLDPFDDLLAPASIQSDDIAYSPSHQLLGRESIPDDFSDLGLGPASAGKSLDAMFGLDDPKPNTDPFAFSSLADPLALPNTSTDHDPLKALAMAHKPRAAAVSDHIPALQHAYVPPPTRTEFVPVDPNTTISRMPTPKRDKPLDNLHAVPSAQTEDPAASPPDQLLAALLQGLQMTHQAPRALTPELMERIGAILRASAEGTTQLLLTRQDFKRELRVDVTMIAASHNNPLKFSPTVEVALAHLLGEQVRGFMAPKDAMRDAFQDLKAHQMGVVVGMKAALAQLLDRFTPMALEEKITAKTKFDALFAANRKAKLWDQFCILQKSISRDAEDDFHSLFGKEFAKTYDEQMSIMKQPGAKGGS